MALTRRDFIRCSCCSAGAFGVATSLSRFGLMHALAQSPAPYQALVCIFLFGGNDANNLLIPNDTAGYNNYFTIRNSGGVALAQNTLLPIASVTPQNGQTSFGLHPSVPELATLYTAGNLAFLANVGTLSQPIDRAKYLMPAPPVPAHLFSHADQQQQWQTLEMDGFYRSGWAGRLADNLAPSMFPPITSVAGSAIFATGQSTSPYAMIPGTTNLGLSGYGGSGAGLTALQALLTFDTGVSLIQAASSIMTNTLADGKILSAALTPPPTFTTVFPGTNLGNQLKQVAQIIKVRSAPGLGLNRQVFFCSLGGFDTHSSQIAIQGPLLQQLSQAVNAFYSATVELGLAQQVTTFTMSDFSRTFQPGSNSGTDHGWGSVQMIVGGAVKGGDIYGTLPVFTLGGPNDAGSNGRWIPTTSADQYGATLAQWFGVTSAANLASIFPNLGNFTTKNLAFI